MKNITVYVVHGYTASSDAEWFPWLKGKLQEIDVNVNVLNMPDANSPVAEKWIECLNENVKELDENTIFVGHSLGCAAILRFLENKPADTKIAGAIFASGFIKKNSKYAIFDSFIKENLDMDKIIKMVKNRCVLSAPNDKYVPYELSCDLAKRFSAKLITIENGGHFIAQEGFSEFSELYEELLRIMNSVEK